MGVRPFEQTSDAQMHARCALPHRGEVRCGLDARHDRFDAALTSLEADARGSRQQAEPSHVIIKGFACFTIYIYTRVN